jgi:hypothetical protein
MYTPFRKDINDPNRYLYHYTSASTALEYILPNGQIRLSPLSKTNDPRESKKWEFSYNIQGVLDKEIPNISDELKEQIQERSKVVCFSKDDRKLVNNPIKVLYRGYSRPRMWAQYGSNHTGVCFVFGKNELAETIKNRLGDLGDIYEGSVRYREILESLNTFSLDCKTIWELGREKYLQYYLKKYYKKLFFEKHQDWRSEFEYRWVLLSKVNTSSYKYIPIHLALKGIVLGADFPEENNSSVLSLNKQYNVPIIKLNWHNGYPSPTTLESNSKKRSFA